MLVVLALAGVGVALAIGATSSDGVDWAELEVGDCIDTPDGDEVQRLEVQACDSPHDAEVFALITHPADAESEFPGTDALFGYAANACLGQVFTDYVGVERLNSELTELQIVPQGDAWEEGRRVLVCAVDNADRSPLTASVQGSGR